MDEGHEVRFAERHFVPRHPANLEQVRDAVDALEVKRRLAPEAPLPPLPEPPAPQPQVRDDLRAALAPHLAEALVAVEVVYRVGRGDVVEARTASGERRLFVVQDGVARPADDIESRIDELPTPKAPEPPAPSASPSPSPAEPEKKSRFSFGRGKKAEPEPQRQPEPQPDEKPKKRFGFGRKGA